MPTTKSKAADAGSISEDAIRQRAYFLWEAAGRPEGTGDHYWHLANEEARPAKSGNGADKAKPAKAKADKPVKLKAAAEPKATRKAATKPRAAVPAKKGK